MLGKIIMKIIEGMEQGSPQWLKFRQFHIGASDAGTIMNLNPFTSKLNLWEEKTLGWQRKVNANMKRGHDLEGPAREEYQILKGEYFYPIVAESSHLAWMSASFDGMTKDLSKAVEIKCGRSSHKLAIKGLIPPYYFAQLQHQMYVAELDSIDYYSFDGNGGKIITIESDEHFMMEMLDKESEFWYCVTSFTPPKD